MDIILGSKNMENVHSDIRGPLFYEALKMEKRGSKILKLNTIYTKCTIIDF